MKGGQLGGGGGGDLEGQGGICKIPFSAGLPVGGPWGAAGGGGGGGGGGWGGGGGGGDT